VAIARAIITQPEVILYDSPTGGLDPVTSNTIIELIVKQRDVYGTSSLLVTHRLQDAFTMASHYFDQKQNKMVPVVDTSVRNLNTKFLMLRDGQIIFEGTAADLLRSNDPYIREYLS
jgi:phospholipid/cholesterol/gamma-HCH transport system ATP-binding protein